MKGKLYLCATPIGNLEDITFRVLRTLKEADLIAAEDTRNSRKLLNHFEIKTPMTSYHEYNKYEKGRWLIRQMEEGKQIALITDAGTPGILIREKSLWQCAGKQGLKLLHFRDLQPALRLLQYPAFYPPFFFEAFLPQDKKQRQEVLEEMKRDTRTLILYEAPHRLIKTLEELLKELGNRRITVCRELTKKHETLFKTDLEKALDWYGKILPKENVFWYWRVDPGKR